MKQQIVLNNGIGLDISAVRMGEDLSVTISGGTKPHIGCCVLAVPRPSLADSNQISSTSSILNVCGHKDDIIAKAVAEKLSSTLNCIVTVSCGIHFDQITKDQMEAILSTPTIVVSMLLQWIHSSGVDR